MSQSALFSRLPLSAVSEAYRAELEKLDDDIFSPGANDQHISKGEIEAALGRIDDPRVDESTRDAIRKAAHLMGYDVGEVDLSDFFMPELQGIDIAELSGDVAAFAKSMDESLGLPSANFNGTLDRQEVAEAMVNQEELSDVQRGYLGMFGQAMGVESPADLEAKAYEILRRAENGDDDAAGNLELVKEHARAAGVDIVRAAELFNEVLNRFGYNNTAEARQGFRLLGHDFLVEGEDATVFQALDAAGERDSGDDALSALRTILEVSEAGYLSIAAASEAYSILREAENGGDDAAGNLRVVVEVAGRIGADVVDTAGLFNEVLTRFGYNNTSEAREGFAYLGDDYVRDGRDSDGFQALEAAGQRDSGADALAALRVIVEVSSSSNVPVPTAAEAYTALREVENGGDDAAGNLKLVAESSERIGAALLDVADHFNEVLTRFGYNNTSEAREGFEVLGDDFAANGAESAYFAALEAAGQRDSGSDALAALRAILQASDDGKKLPQNLAAEAYAALRKAENGGDDAAGNLSLVIQTAGEIGGDVLHVTALFNNVLQGFGSNNTSEAREGFKALGHLYARGDAERGDILASAVHRDSGDDALEAVRVMLAAADESGFATDEVTAAFDSLREAENGGKDAAGNLELVVKTAAELGTSLAAETARFNEILERHGSNNTSEAREEYAAAA